MESDEVIVGTEYGVYRTSSIKRTSADKRWDLEAVKKVSGTPEKPYQHTDDDRSLTRPPLSKDHNAKGDPSNVARKIEEDPAPKQINIERKDLEKVGYTPGCAGCYNARLRKAYRPNSDHCRQRVLEEMNKIPHLRRKSEAAVAREERWLERHAETDGEEEDAEPRIPIEEDVEVEREDSEVIQEDIIIPSTSVTPLPQKQDLDDTTEFYQEINDELMDQIESDAMESIDAVIEPNDVIAIVHDAMRKVITTVKPNQVENDAEVTQILRLAGKWVSHMWLKCTHLLE